MKVALVYDRVNKFGGAERGLLALHKIFPDAPLYTSVYDPAAAGWADVFEVRTSFLQKLPIPKNAHEYYPFLMGIAFESFNFDEFDLVISVTHEFAKAIITKPSTIHICYCLNPVGYLWDSYEDYFSTKPKLFKSLSLPLIKILRIYDKVIANRPDKILTISKTVQERIKRIYGRESEVIYPPVEILLKPVNPLTRQQNNSFLTVSRLAKAKHIDVLINAANKLKFNLKIVGSGRDLERLKQISGPTVEFLGNLTDEELKKIYINAKAFLFAARDEEFGIAVVEAMGYELPVIAYRSGGIPEYVIDGKNGFLFDQLDPYSLIKKLEEFNKLNKERLIEMKKEARKTAEQFSEENFKRNIINFIKSKTHARTT